MEKQQEVKEIAKDCYNEAVRVINKLFDEEKVDNTDVNMLNLKEQLIVRTQVSLLIKKLAEYADTTEN